MSPSKKDKTFTRARIGMAALAGVTLRATCGEKHLLSNAAEKYGVTWIDARMIRKTLDIDTETRRDVILSAGEHTVIILDLQAENLVWRAFHLLGHVACGHSKDFDLGRLSEEARSNRSKARLLNILETEADVFALSALLDHKAAA